MSMIEQYPERPLPECLYGTREFEERRNARAAAMRKPVRRSAEDVVQVAPYTNLRGALDHHRIIRERFAKAHVREVVIEAPAPCVPAPPALNPDYHVWFAPADEMQVEEPRAVEPEEQTEPAELLKPAITLKRIIAFVSAYYGVTALDIISERRTSTVMRPRMVGMYLAKNTTPRSYPQIGYAFGGRDHTTAISAVRRVALLLEHDADLVDDVAHLTAALNGDEALIVRPILDEIIQPWAPPRQWSQSERDDIVSCKGVMSAAEVGKRYGVQRGTISAIWHRAAMQERGQ